MRRTSGLTLLEALVALAIFGLVAVMATIGVSGALRAQSLNEAVTSSQSRLRRVTEVFTQELRSDMLGGLSNAPYVSNSHEVSFLTLVGGAGDPVDYQDNGNNASFEQADNINLIWGDNSVRPANALTGHHLLMINGNGDAIVFKVTNVADNGNGTYNVVHAGCSNTIPYVDTRTMTMRSRSVGFRFDPSTGTLYTKIGSGPEVPMAFDLGSVQLEYVYETDSGATVVRSTPLTNGSGLPVRQGLIDGQNATLQRVGLTAKATDGSGGSQVTRVVSGEVAISSGSSLSINEVQVCN